MSSLNLIDTKQDLPLHDAGSEGWCTEVKELALGQVLATTEGGKVESADVVHLMKIRRTLVEQQRQDRKITWLDPERWKEDPPQAA
jgi:hypothetical protein